MIFKTKSQLDIGKLAMWRLKFGDATWLSDYVVNYRDQHLEFVEENKIKLTKSKLKEMIREEIQNLNEGKKLVNLVNNLEQFIWYKAKNRNVKNKWDDYTDSLMDSEEAKYWTDLGSMALQRAYDFGISLLKKNRIKYKK